MMYSYMEKSFLVNQIIFVIPYYFKFNDANETLGEQSLAKCRANAVYSLFSTPKPYIYDNTTAFSGNK